MFMQSGSTYFSAPALWTGQLYCELTHLKIMKTQRLCRFRFNGYHLRVCICVLDNDLFTCIFMHVVKTYICLCSSVCVCVFPHPENPQLILPSDIRDTAPATGAHNGYTDQTWITSGTFNVESDTRMTDLPWVIRPIPSSPSVPIFSLHLGQREGHSLSAFELRVKRLIPMPFRVSDSPRTCRPLLI